MRFVVVDTDAFSEIWQGSSDHLAAHLVESIPVISFATVAELHFGAAKACWSERRIVALEEAIRRYLIAPFDSELARLWGRLKARLFDVRRAGCLFSLAPVIGCSGSVRGCGSWCGCGIRRLVVSPV